MAKRLSQQTITTITTGGYLHIILPDGGGGFDSFRILVDDLTSKTNQTQNLTSVTDVNITNPFTLPVIPRIIQVYDSSGVEVVGIYKEINQTTGDITLNNSGATISNAIINIQGW